MTKISYHGYRFPSVIIQQACRALGEGLVCDSVMKADSIALVLLVVKTRSSTPKVGAAACKAFVSVSVSIAFVGLTR
jgi:hypothetical protein